MWDVQHGVIEALRRAGAVTNEQAIDAQEELIVLLAENTTALKNESWRERRARRKREWSWAR